MDKGRLEAFSDGVLAIAITLLVLELKIPEYEPGHLWPALMHEWPQFAAFAVTFAVIGIIWVNHHNLIRMLSHVDHTFLFLNLALLFVVVILPFPTGLLASVLTKNSGDSHIAAALYGTAFFAMAVVFSVMWLWAMTNGRLLSSPLSRERWRAMTLRFGMGAVPYLVSIGLAFVDARLTLLIVFLVAIYYTVNQLAAPEVLDVSPPMVSTNQDALLSTSADNS